jgi:alpha-L-rhamnosidase
MVKSAWAAGETNTTFDVVIPPNTTATVYLPAESTDKITEGLKPLSSFKEIQVIGKEGDYVKLTIGSGKYRFTVTK